MTLTADTLTADTRTDQASDAVTLTVLPALHPHLIARIRRWDDRDQFHKAVMSLFPDNLNGPPETRRATARILYRHETPTSGTPRVLIQHHTPMLPDVTADPAVRQTSLTPVLTRLTPGTHVRFRTTLNPVKAITGSNHRTAITDPDELTTWALHKLTQAGLTDVILNDDPATDLLRTSAAKLWTAQYDGHATVTDPAMLTAAIHTGIGRAKAYGCGLLSILPG